MDAEDPRRPLRRALDVGARGPLAVDELINPLHMREPQVRPQGETPRLWKGK